MPIALINQSSAFTRSTQTAFFILCTPASPSARSWIYILPNKPKQRDPEDEQDRVGDPGEGDAAEEGDKVEEGEEGGEGGSYFCEDLAQMC
jgi:hypothetical protein